MVVVCHLSVVVYHVAISEVASASQKKEREREGSHVACLNVACHSLLLLTMLPTVMWPLLAKAFSTISIVYNATLLSERVSLGCLYLSFN
jgi:hypothetical protein